MEKVLIWSTFVSFPTSVCSLNPVLHASQSSCLFMKGIIHGAHSCYMSSDIPNVPASRAAEWPLRLSRGCSCCMSPASLCVISNSLLSSCLPISLKYLWIFMLRLFLAKIDQTPLLKVKTCGDGKCREERLVPWQRDREQVYCLGFLPLRDQGTTAPPEHALGSYST